MKCMVSGEYLCRLLSRCSELPEGLVVVPAVVPPVVPGEVVIGAVVVVVVGVVLMVEVPLDPMLDRIVDIRGQEPPPHAFLERCYINVMVPL